jgi:hypothetical protein
VLTESQFPTIFTELKNHLGNSLFFTNILFLYLATSCPNAFAMRAPAPCADRACRASRGMIDHYRWLDNWIPARSTRE